MGVVNKTDTEIVVCIPKDDNPLTVKSVSAEMGLVDLDRDYRLKGTNITAQYSRFADAVVAASPDRGTIDCAKAAGPSGSEGAAQAASGGDNSGDNKGVDAKAEKGKGKEGGTSLGAAPLPGEEFRFPASLVSYRTALLDEGARARASLNSAKKMASLAIGKMKTVADFVHLLRVQQCRNNDTREAIGCSAAAANIEGWARAGHASDVYASAAAKDGDDERKAFVSRQPHLQQRIDEGISLARSAETLFTTAIQFPMSFDQAAEQMAMLVFRPDNGGIYQV